MTLPFLAIIIQVMLSSNPKRKFVINSESQIKKLFKIYNNNILEAYIYYLTGCLSMCN